jgi:hypothetical protein
MLKIGLTAAVTATLCFAIAAATGFGAAEAKVATPKLTLFNLKVNEIVALTSDNFHCQVLTTTEVACGANSLPKSIQVYFAPHNVAVVQFDKTGKKGKILGNIKR